MACQNAGQQPSFTPPHANILIRMKRKRHAPPLESFLVEMSLAENPMIKQKHTSKDKSSKTIFTRANSIDMKSPINCEIAKMLGNESEKQTLSKNDLGGQMKKLKLGDLETENKETTSIPQISKPKTISTETTSNNSHAKNVQVFDISKDVKTDTLSIQSVSAQAPTGNPIVTCNGETMIRESVGPNTHQSTDDQNYVYDIYYTKDADLSMFDDPTSILINPLDYDITWTDPLTNPHHTLYDEDFNDNGLSDDSNDEDNWRNEYGEEPDYDSEVEIDRMHYSKYRVEMEDYDLSDFDESEYNKNPNWIDKMGEYHLKHEKDLYFYDKDEYMSDH